MSLFEKLKNKRYDLQEAPIDDKGMITPEPGEIKKSKKILKKYVDQQKKKEQKNQNPSTRPSDNRPKRGSTTIRTSTQLDLFTNKVDPPKEVKVKTTYKPRVKKQKVQAGSSDPSLFDMFDNDGESTSSKTTATNTKTVKQSEVSKKAKEFTKKVNKERVKKLAPIDLNKPTKRIDLRTIKKRTTGRKRPSNAQSLADITKKIDAKNPVEIGKTGPKPVKGTVLRVLKKGEVASKSVMQKNVPQGFVRIPKKDAEAQNIIKKQVKTAKLLDPTPKPKPSTKPNLFSKIKNFVKSEPKIPSDYKLVRGTTNQPLSVTRKVYKGKLGAVRKFVDKLPRKYKLAGTALLATAAIAPNIKNPFAPKPEKKSYTVANKTLKLDTGKKNT